MASIVGMAEKKKSFGSFRKTKNGFPACSRAGAWNQAYRFQHILEVSMGTLGIWLRQPTTVAGISTFFGTVIALLLKQMSLAEAAPLLAGGAMSIILPDNSTAKQQAEELAKDVVSGAAQKPGAGA